KRFDISIEDYLVMSTHKTAFYSGGVPLACGAIIGGGSEEQIEALRAFGMATGLAFQIQDDLLNLVTSEDKASKDFRGDITEGKRTLIAVHAIQNSEPKDRDELVAILAAHTSDRVLMDRAVEIMQKAGSLAYAHEYALRITAQAKQGIVDVLPASPERDLLLSMADFFVERLS
ncbi:MAG: polyprenyl synthetase family protein, partial [Coriobacteriales bacterium]|nr:polyprenyl synthetase family protein [Coriobacteriales bacterium]